MQDRWLRNKPPRICVVIGLQHYFVVKEISETPERVVPYPRPGIGMDAGSAGEVVLVLGAIEGRRSWDLFAQPVFINCSK